MDGKHADQVCHLQDPVNALWQAAQLQIATDRAGTGQQAYQRSQSDKLESRLIFLRRLQHRCDFMSLTQVGREQFRLDLERQLTLEERS